jgi:hypothetical protein
VSSGNDVGVENTREDTKVVVARRDLEESMVWSQSRGSSGRKMIEQVGGGVKTLHLEARGQGDLGQKSARDIIRGANHALNLVVLGRGARTRHLQLYTPREEDRAEGVVIKLTPVVALDDLNGEAELSGHVGKEDEESGQRLKLGMQRESPRVVRKIINHYQIILIAGNSKNRRSPQITVNKIKGMHHMRRRKGRRTWQPNWNAR